MAPKEPTKEIPADNEVPGFPLTKEFLEFTFEKEVETFTVTVGTNPGDNFLSIMHAVDLIFKGEKERKYYLIKCYPNHSARRDFLDQMNVFEKELFMYSEFLPILKKMAKETEADEKIVNLSLAPFHGGNVAVAPSKKFKGTQWETENFIVMTDLRKKNYTMSDRTKGLDIEHATLVLKEMAKLHALSWAHKEKLGLKLLSSKYPTFIDTLYSKDELNDQFKSLMAQITDNALKMTEDSLGADHPAYNGFKKILDVPIMDTLKKYMQPQTIDEDEFEDILRIKPKEDTKYNKEPWLVGTHGDCWINNMLFKYDNSQGQPKPTDVIFVDFQIYREACPTVDIAYFFCSSVRAGIRNAHKDELLQAYYSAFLLYCNELGVKPYPGFSMKSLKRRYLRAEVFGLLIALPMLSIVLKPKEEAIDLDKTEGKDASELFSKVLDGSDKNTNFQDEVVATVLDLYENGII